MRAHVAIFAVLFTAAAMPARAQEEVCNNIRLSASEQFECRSRLQNSLGEGDRARLQTEYEDRIRRGNDNRVSPVTPPAAVPLPSTGTGVSDDRAIKPLPSPPGDIASPPQVPPPIAPVPAPGTP